MIHGKSIGKAISELAADYGEEWAVLVCKWLDDEKTVEYWGPVKFDEDDGDFFVECVGGTATWFESKQRALEASAPLALTHAICLVKRQTGSMVASVGKTDPQLGDFNLEVEWGILDSFEWGILDTAANHRIWCSNEKRARELVAQNERRTPEQPVKLIRRPVGMSESVE